MTTVPGDNDPYLTNLDERFLALYKQFFGEIRDGNRVMDLLLLRLQIDNILTEIELIAHAEVYPITVGKPAAPGLRR